MKKLKISLMFKITLLCVGLVMVSSLVISLFAFSTAKSTINKSMGQSALTITRSVAQIIDGDKLQELKTPADMETDYYKQLRDEFIKIRKETGLKFLYTMARKEDGSVVYIMDGSDYGSEDESFIGDVETDVSYKMLQSLDGKEDYEYYDGDWGALISGYVPLINSKGECIGMLGADFDAEVMKKNLSETSRMMILVTAIVIVIGILVSLGFTYLIVRFIKLLNSKVQLIQGGDLTVNIETNRSDEVGSLAASFRKMIEKMSDMIHNIRDHSEKVSQDVDSLNGSIDVSNRATEEINKVVAEIASGAVQQVESVEAVENSMQHVFTEIETITKNIDSVGADSDHAVADMQEASEKLSSSVQQINLVNDTVEVTATMMKQLEEKFKEVLSFSDSVTEIATRTNLLALNASIEAASAGEHGRGFAVVAREINSLAKQSRDASKRINDLIVAVQEEIRNSSNAIGNGVIQARNGVSVMSEVEQHLDKLSDTNRKMNSRLKEISQAILRIEDDSRNVLDKTTLLADIARDLSAGTQQTAAETEEQYAIMEGIKNDLAKVKDQMQSLSSTVNQFKIQ